MSSILPQKTPNTLNDLARLQSWQQAMPDFEVWQSDMLDNSAIQDYLSCYGLDHCVQNSRLSYQAGYRTINSERIFHQCFKQNNPQAELVMVVHGYTDHAGLFIKVIKHLIERGYSVCIADFVGHGLSSGERATTNNFDCYRAILNNSILFFQELTKQPLHIVAQSLGGAITMHWLLVDKPEAFSLRNIVLLAPLVRPRAWLQANWSYRFLSKVVDSIPRNFSRNSEDEAFVDFLQYGDPVQHHRLPAEWVGSLIAWVKEFEELPNNEFPLTIIQGDNDETVDAEFNTQHIQAKFPNSTLYMVVGAGHHLAGESARLQEYIFSYLDAGLQRS